MVLDPNNNLGQQVGQHFLRDAETHFEKEDSIHHNAGNTTTTRRSRRIFPPLQQVDEVIRASTA